MEVHVLDGVHLPEFPAYSGGRNAIRFPFFRQRPASG
jgi:hypothetical protein